MDHFMSNMEALNQALWKLRVTFITHIHGDH
jgi:ribonuclease Z